MKSIYINFILIMTLTACGGGGLDVVVDGSQAGASIPTSYFIKQVGDTTIANFNGALSSSGDEGLNGMVIDSSGNMYVVGETDGDLGETNGGGDDAYIAKFDSNGNIQWITQLGAVHEADADTTLIAAGAADANDRFDKVVIDNSGYLYTAGYSSGNLGETNGGNKDLIVAKFSSTDGSLIWITQLGSVHESDGDATIVGAGDADAEELAYSIDIDPSGNVYVGGSTTGSIGTTANLGGPHDNFVAKFNNNGVAQWITTVGSTGADYGGHVLADSSGSSYISGSTAGNVGEPNGGSYDVYLSKLNSSGVVQWTTQLGATHEADGDTNLIAAGASDGEDGVYGMDFDASGNILMTGYTRGDLGEPNGGGQDIFVSSFDSTSGALLWLTQLGDTHEGGSILAAGAADGNDNTDSVFTDASGNIFLAGDSNGNLGSSNGGNPDAIILKFNSSGVLQWVRQVGGDDEGSTILAGGADAREELEQVAVDSAGNIYVAGDTQSNMKDTNNGQKDMIIMKFNSSGQLQ